MSVLRLAYSRCYSLRSAHAQRIISSKMCEIFAYQAFPDRISTIADSIMSFRHVLSSRSNRGGYLSRAAYPRSRCRFASWIGFMTRSHTRTHDYMTRFDRIAGPAICSAEGNIDTVFRSGISSLRTFTRFE